MNDVEASVIGKYLELKDFNLVDKEMGFKPGWTELIINKIKDEYCFGGEKYDKIQKISKTGKGSE